MISTGVASDLDSATMFLGCLARMARRRGVVRIWATIDGDSSVLLGESATGAIAGASSCPDFWSRCGLLLVCEEIVSVFDSDLVSGFPVEEERAGPLTRRDGRLLLDGVSCWVFSPLFSAGVERGSSTNWSPICKAIVVYQNMRDLFIVVQSTGPTLPSTYADVVATWKSCAPSWSASTAARAVSIEV